MQSFVFFDNAHTVCTESRGGTGKPKCVALREGWAGDSGIAMVRWVREDAATAEMEGENIVNILAGCGGGWRLETLYPVMASWS
jgi:hypothetical protein